MSKIVAINAAAGVKATFTNIYGTAAYKAKENKALAELSLPLEDDDVFNTGLATVGNPHIDEIALGQKMAPPFENPAILKDVNTWHPQHVVGLRLFKNNTFVYLLPGDSIVITCASAEEAAYYFGIHDEMLSATFDYVTKGEDHSEEVVDPKAQLDRTTGIGDSDDGNADTIYPFQFDTEAATSGKLESEAVEPEPNPDPDPENP